jgi:hypothetical protein
MTFLQPLLLWGLPLVLAPVLLHLLNRLRYRTVAWAAMGFLLAATRQSTRHARLRQWLVLACRIGAVLCLVLALSRPQVGGWLGWALHGPPETVLVLLDLSASMGDTAGPGQPPLLEVGLRQMAHAAATTGASRWVVLESRTRQPQELPSPERLAHLPGTRVGDTGGDLLALLEAAADYLHRQPTGRTELWLATDLQAANWPTDAARWAALRARFDALPQPVRLRLLALTPGPQPNHAVSLGDVLTFASPAGRRLVLDLHLRSSTPGDDALPVAVTLGGRRTQFTVTPRVAELRLQHSLALNEDETMGHGELALPADRCAGDNRAWFVYGAPAHARQVVGAEARRAEQVLRLAAGGGQPEASVEVVPVAGETPLPLDAAALVLWQGAWPAAGRLAQLAEFVQSGGVVVAFPGSIASPATLDGLGWGSMTEAPDGQPWRVTGWEDQTGPLARASGGEALPLAELAVTRRCALLGEGEVLATFADGQPLLLRRQLGQGQVWLWATAPLGAWSSLGAGPVLVPAVQRAAAIGARRLAALEDGWCGELCPAPGEPAWEALAPSGADPLVDAGVYRAGQRLIALHRPPAEDLPDRLPPERLAEWLGDLPCVVFAAPAEATGALQSEVWRGLLAALLLLLLAESVLTLPARPPAAATGAEAV